MSKDKKKGDETMRRAAAERMLEAVVPTCDAAIRRAYMAETLPGSSSARESNDGRVPGGDHGLH
jgi:hypothetical protein